MSRSAFQLCHGFIEHFPPIQNLELVALKRDDYGKFHKGDSYLVVNASEYGKPGGMLDIVSVYSILVHDRLGLVFTNMSVS